MKIAVTAANGQLGRAAVQALIKELGAEQVIGIARTPEKAESLGIEIRKGDYDKFDDFAKALQGVDRLLLISGMDAPKKRIQQHRKIIRAAEQNQVQKMVYTSIIGDSANTSFDPIIDSNRQTERDLAASGLDWVIARNGLYLEPDLEFLDRYRQAGFIWNSAGNGRCAYTSREELARAYTRMLLRDDLVAGGYQLAAEPITQQELASLINAAYGTRLTYKHMSVDDYLEDRKNELGNFIGTVVAGIYEGISKGGFDLASDFEQIVGRPHQSVAEMIQNYMQSNS